MFNRILNAKKPVKFDGRYDKNPYGTVERFNELRDGMLAYLEPIADALQCDYGAKLQRKDSELALKVIEACMERGIPVYPIHDSFIVRSLHREEVERIMKNEFGIMFRYNIDISFK